MKLITITGPSGAGKDTVAQLLSEETDIPVLVSYTTRPMREGEVNGREHYFVKECTTDKKDMLAYTVYGGYEYWTEVYDVHDIAIYVIDEEGLRDLHDRFPHIELLSVYVTAIEDVRRQRGVSQERMERDLQRQVLPIEYYDYRISNNKSIVALKHKVKDMAQYVLHNQ